MQLVLMAWVANVVFLACGLQEPISPGLKTGEGLMRKSQFTKVEGIGEITDMRLGRVIGMEEDALIVVGHLGYAVVAPDTGELLRRTTFKPDWPAFFAQAPFIRRIGVDADGDGYLEFLALPRSWVGRVSLHDSSGELLWSYPPSVKNGDKAIQRSSVVDVDGDGKIAILLTYNAEREVELLSYAGKLLWAQDWEGHRISNILFRDVLRDGKMETLYVDGSGLWVRSLGVESVARRLELPGQGYVNHLSAIQGFGSPPGDFLLVGQYASGEQQYYLVDCDATKIVKRVQWPDVEFYREATAMFLGGTQLYAYVDRHNVQAPVAGFSKTFLRVIVTDGSRRVLYEEILKPEGSEKLRTDGTVCVVQGLAEKQEILLLAYGDVIWQYVDAR